MRASLHSSAVLHATMCLPACLPAAPRRPGLAQALLTELRRTTSNDDRPGPYTPLDDATTIDLAPARLSVDKVIASVKGATDACNESSRFWAQPGTPPVTIATVSICRRKKGADDEAVPVHCARWRLAFADVDIDGAPEPQHGAVSATRAH